VNREVVETRGRSLGQAAVIGSGDRHARHLEAEIGEHPVPARRSPTGGQIGAIPKFSEPRTAGFQEGLYLSLTILSQLQYAAQEERSPLCAG
jgi:hypothetical protein